MQGKAAGGSIREPSEGNGAGIISTIPASLQIGISYWIPVFEILDQRGFEVILVNARDAKHVPGRKTDISDAQWLQRLHEYGLLRASFRLKGEVAVTCSASIKGSSAFWCRLRDSRTERISS
nr:hypothetical protein [Mesorhizobium sp. AR07]